MPENGVNLPGSLWRSGHLEVYTRARRSGAIRVLMLPTISPSIPWLLALLTAGTPPGGVATEPAPSTEAPAANARTSADDPRIDEAYAASGAGQHVEAADTFEGLWRDHGGPRFLFNAAVSRFAARHHAHAIAHLEIYLKLPDLTDTDKEEALRQFDVIKNGALSTTITVRGVPVSVEPLHVELKRVSEDASDLRPALGFEFQRAGSTATRQLWLDPGTWIVRSACPGSGVQGESRVEVAAGTAAGGELTLDCEVVAPVVHDDARPRRSLAIATGALGGVSLLSGIVVAAIFTRKQNVLRDGPIGDPPCSSDGSCHARLIYLNRRASVGVTLIGFGAGLALGATALVRDPVRRRKAWFGELGAGLVVMVGAFAGRAGFLKAASNNIWKPDSTFENWDTSRTNPELTQQLAGKMVMETFVGVGAGAVISAATGLILDRPGRASKPTARSTWRAEPAFAPGFSGLMMSGRF